MIREHGWRKDSLGDSEKKDGGRFRYHARRLLATQGWKKDKATVSLKNKNHS